MSIQFKNKTRHQVKISVAEFEIIFFFIIIYCTKEQQGSFTISLSALKRSVGLFLNSSIFIIGLKKGRFVHLLIRTDIKKINHCFKFTPWWTVQLLSQ